MMQTITQEISTIHFLLLALTALIHIIFAGAVAKDAGDYHKKFGATHLVNGTTWAFSTLVGGIFVGALYWFMHRVNWQRR